MLSLLLAMALPAPIQAQVRDSAGIRIIEASAPQFTGARAWRLAPQPVFSLGGGLPDAADEILMGHAPVEFADGRFVITHSRTQSVRFYTPTGRLLLSVGRSGEGPGEFRMMIPFRGRGDTVVIHDGLNGRLTWIAPTGTIVRMSPFRPRVANVGYGQGMTVDVRSTFTDGQLALTSWPLFSLPPRAMQYQDSLLILRCLPTTCTPTPILRTAGTLMAYTGTAVGQGLPVPFGSHAVTTFHADRIFVSQMARAEIEEYTPDGTLRQIFRLRQPQRPISEAFIQARRNKPKSAEYTTWSPKRKAVWDYAFLFPPNQYPPFFQPFSALYADPDGGVYALESEDPTQPRTLAAFSPTGAFLARIPIPDNVLIRAVGRAGIYLTRTDDDGFTHLMLYRILKP